MEAGRHGHRETRGMEESDATTRVRRWFTGFDRPRIRRRILRLIRRRERRQGRREARSGSRCDVRIDRC